MNPQSPVPPISNSSEPVGQPGAGVGAGISLAVLSRDEALLDALYGVVTSDHAINLCESESALVEQVLAGACGVAVIDGQATSEPLAALVDRLREQFPDLVLVVAGAAEQQAQIAARITDGAVYRFLHKPVSAQRVRLFVEAALRRHGEIALTARASSAAQQAAESSLATPSRGARGGASRDRSPSPLVWVGVAALIAAAIGITVWGVGGDDEAAAPAASAPAGGATGAPAAASNAADTERRVSDLLAAAEQAILQERLDDAGGLIDQARALQPQNPRVAFLTAQLGKERERALIARARSAAASGDLNTALRVLDGNAMGAASPTDGSQAVEETRRALVQQQADERVRALLQRANARLQAGALITPASDNARFYLESARAIAPRDPEIPELARQINQRLVADARAAATRGDAQLTELLLTGAAEGGVGRDVLDPIRAQLAGTQNNARANDVSRLAALVSQRISQGRLLDPAADSAQGYFQQLVAIEPAGTAAQSLRSPLRQAMLVEARGALGRGELDLSTRHVEAARELGADVGGLAGEIAAARERRDRQSQVVGVSQLRRTRSADPVYPRFARERDIEGWVDLEFTVATDGNVRDIVVVGAQPNGVFDRAASDAVARWRFEPVVVAGAPIEQRARVRLRFNVEQ